MRVYVCASSSFFLRTQRQTNVVGIASTIVCVFPVSQFGDNHKLAAVTAFPIPYYFSTFPALGALAKQSSEFVANAIPDIQVERLYIFAPLAVASFSAVNDEDETAVASHIEEMCRAYSARGILYSVSRVFVIIVIAFFF